MACVLPARDEGIEGDVLWDLAKPKPGLWAGDVTSDA